MTRHTRYLKGGGVRKLFEARDRSVYAGRAVPRRASRVEVIEEPGPSHGLFHVDFSPLGDDYRFCLARTFADYHEAVAAEQDWLVQNWIYSCLPKTNAASSSTS